MITELHVKNLALIDETTVNFGSGLNILTGETGAGKSILIGSVNMALGQKMTRDIQRDETKPTLVELIFQVDNDKVKQKLEEMDVETEDGLLIISRKFQDGRSVTRLNGEACTAAKIRQISSLLLDIHGQHEHQSLLYTNRQLEILDAYGRASLGELLGRTEEAYRAYKQCEKELERFGGSDEERERELSLLRYEINEIEEAAPVEGEEDDLEKTYRRMSNSKKIVEALGAVYQLTGGDDGADGRIGQALREMRTAAGYDDELEQMASSLTDIDGLLSDFNREVSGYLDDFTFSEEEFYETEQRLDTLNHLKSKYGRTITDVLSYMEKQQVRLDELEHFAARKAAAEKELADAETKLEQVSAALSAERKKVAATLAEQIKTGLYDLNFLSVEFEIAFERSKSYGKNGFDEIEFRISTNPGEPVRSLAKVVSGGELSRIMLAIKTLLADKDETETLIFDEIDTGISGRTAQKVSEKMAKIANGHQVICITHLAQIASMADTHFVISKAVENQMTETSIRKLVGDEPTEELARILGGAEITETVYENAREMKRLAQETKAHIFL